MAEEKHVRLKEVQESRKKTYGNFKSNIALMRKITGRISFDKKSKANTFIKNILALKLARAAQGNILKSDISDSLLDFCSYLELLKSNYGVITKFTELPLMSTNNKFGINKEFTTDDVLNNVENFLALKGAPYITLGE